MSAQRTVSIQEAVHLVDKRDLILCYNKITYLSVRQGAILTNEKDKKKKRDIISMNRNQSNELAHLSLDKYFCQQFCKEVLKDNGGGDERTKHRILLLLGQNCLPCYPVTYEYARGVLIQYKPWAKQKPLTKLLKNWSNTILTFKRMIDRQ